jgi:hypothetical protein
MSPLCPTLIELQIAGLLIASTTGIISDSALPNMMVKKQEKSNPEM